MVAAPLPPRQLPTQDHPALDERERAAARLTWLVAAAAAMVLLVVTLVVAGVV